MLKSNENGYCPNCDADFDGGSIYETGLKFHGSEEKALEYAAAYGATKEKGQWGRQISIYCMERDRTVSWKCPDCDHEWSRK